MLGEKLARDRAPGHADPGITQGREHAALDAAEDRCPVPRHAKDACPGVFEIQIAEHRKTLAHALDMCGEKLPPHGVAQAEITRVEGAMTIQQSVRERAPDRRATGNAPILRTGHRRLFLVGQRPRDACASDHWEQVTPEEAEFGDERVGGEQDVRGVDRTLGAFDPHRRTGLDPGHRRFLVDLDVRRHRLAQATAQRGRVHQHRARCIDGGVVMARSHHVGQGIAVEPLVFLVDHIERAAQGPEVRDPFAVDDRGQVAARRPFAFDRVLADEAFELGESGDHQPRDASVGIDVESLGEVRGVDDEAGASPRGAVADPVRLEQDDARLGREFGEPAGGGEAGDAGADNDPVGGLLALESIGRRRRRQHRVPPRRLGHVGKQGVMAGHGSTPIVGFGHPKASAQRRQPRRSLVDPRSIGLGNDGSAPRAAPSAQSGWTPWRQPSPASYRDDVASGRHHPDQ